MILITTAGKVGTVAARRLAESGVPVRVVARHPEKAAELARVGVDVFQADLDVPESIDPAMKGVSGVILVTLPVVHQELSVIYSAKRTSVGHVVKVTTKATADSPIARRRNHVAVEQALIASVIRYTLLRSNAYMQNFLMMAPGIARASIFRTATGDGCVWHVDARDVGAVAAEIAASPAGHEGKTYWPTGPEALSGYQVAEIFTKVPGRVITFRPIP